MLKKDELLVNNDDELLVTNEDGVEELCRILFTHQENDKMYVVFEFIESGNISGAQFLPGEDESEGEFLDIETEEEWDMLDQLLENYYDDLDEEDTE